jgi:hypothetical protein
MADRDKSPLSRTLEAFANAVLDRTLPHLRQWLVARLGPSADLRSLELDGPRVHLVDAMLPLGPHLVLRVDEATLLTRPEQLVLGLPPVSLERLVGRLELTRGGPTLQITLESASTRASDAWVAGWLTITATEVGGAAWRGSAYVRLTSTRFLVEAAKVDELDGSGHLDLSLGGTLDASGFTLTDASATLRHAPAAALLELRRLFDAPTVALRAPVRLSGSARLARDGAVSAELRADDHLAHLTLEGHAHADGRLDAHGHGALDPSLVEARPALHAEGPPLSVVLRLLGTRERPRLELDARTDALSIATFATALRRVELRCALEDGLSLDARARLGERGRITLTRASGRAFRLRVERAPLAALDRTLLDRVLPAGIEHEGSLWIDVELDAERASGSAHLETRSLELAVRPLCLAFRDRALDGSIVRAEASVQPFVPRARGTLSLVLTLTYAPLDRFASWRAEGDVRAARIDVLVPRADLALEDAMATVRLVDGDLAIDGARARFLGGTLHGSGRIRDVSGRRAIELDALSARALCDGASLLRRWARLPDAPFEGLVLDADLARHDGAITGQIEARTPRSSIVIRPRLRGLALDGSTIEGRLAVADVGPFVRAWTLRPDEEALWSLEGSIDGDLFDASLQLAVQSEAQRVWVRSSRGPVALEAHACAGRVDVTRERIAWRALSARGYGGTARSEGCYVLALGALFARIEGQGVALGALPLPRGGALGAHVEGVLSGTLDVFTTPRAAVAHGRARIDAPRYHALERSSAVRAWIELSETASASPLEAILRMDDEAWTATELAAALGALEARGTIALRHDGRVHGQLLVRPSHDWRRESVLVGPLADALGPFPFRLAGTLEAPRAELRTSLEDLLDLSASALAVARVSEPRSTPALLAAMAREPDPELFEALIARGVHPAEIGEEVARARGNGV